MIPISSVNLDKEVEDLVLEVIRSGQIAQGSLVEEFENEFAKLHQVRNAIAVNNGTTALVAAMQAVGIKPGDEVITSPFTFVATLNAILEAGGTARFADIGSDFNVCAENMASLINANTKALVPVHLYGYMADMEPIMSIASTQNLRVIEDSAQAIFAEYNGKRAGSYDIGCFSLYATKNLTTGEGGVITTNDDEIAERVRLLRNQGMKQRYQYEIAGHNYRMTNLGAAVGLPQLRRIEETSHMRASNAQILREGLEGIRGIEIPEQPTKGRSHVYHQFTIRVKDEFHLTRDEVIEELAKMGIGSGIYYPKVGTNNVHCFNSEFESN